MAPALTWYSRPAQRHMHLTDADYLCGWSFVGSSAFPAGGRRPPARATGIRILVVSQYEDHQGAADCHWRSPPGGSGQRRRIRWTCRVTQRLGQSCSGRTGCQGAPTSRAGGCGCVVRGSIRTHDPGRVGGPGSRRQSLGASGPWPETPRIEGPPPCGVA
jgi:hypothetical protein